MCVYMYIYIIVFAVKTCQDSPSSIVLHEIHPRFKKVTDMPRRIFLLLLLDPLNMFSVQSHF